MVDSSLLTSVLKDNSVVSGLKEQGLLPEEFTTGTGGTPQEQIAELVRRGLSLQRPPEQQAPASTSTQAIADALSVAQVASPTAQEEVTGLGTLRGETDSDRGKLNPVTSEPATFENQKRLATLASIAGSLTPIPLGGSIGGAIGEASRADLAELEARRRSGKPVDISKGKAAIAGLFPFTNQNPFGVNKQLEAGLRAGGAVNIGGDRLATQQEIRDAGFKSAARKSGQPLPSFIRSRFAADPTNPATIRAAGRFQADQNRAQDTPAAATFEGRVDRRGNVAGVAKGHTNRARNKDGSFTVDAQGRGRGDAGGTVICTELHRQGLLPHDVYRADKRFGLKLMREDRDVIKGYHFWAKPVVKYMQKSKVFTYVVHKSVGEAWAKEMAVMGGLDGIGTLRGKILVKFGIPVCRFIGKMLSKRYGKWHSHQSLHL
jgi:hypothetical protein